MKHIKTLNTQTLQNTMKKVGVASARHLVSLHVRLLALWEIRAARTIDRIKRKNEQRLRRCLFS